MSKKTKAALADTRAWLEKTIVERDRALAAGDNARHRLVALTQRVNGLRLEVETARKEAADLRLAYDRLVTRTVPATDRRVNTAVVDIEAGEQSCETQATDDEAAVSEPAADSAIDAPDEPSPDHDPALTAASRTESGEVTAETVAPAAKEADDAERSEGDEQAASDPEPRSWAEIIRESREGASHFTV